MGVGVINNEDIIEVLSDSPEAHPDPSIDVIYTSLPKRVSKLTSKILLNEKWGDIKMWTQRAIAHTKCNKTLEAKRLYYR